MVLDSLLQLVADKWVGLVLLLVIAFIAYKMVQKVTKFIFKVVSFVVVLVIVYYILSTIGLI